MRYREIRQLLLRRAKRSAPRRKAAFSAFGNGRAVCGRNSSGGRTLTPQKAHHKMISRLSALDYGTGLWDRARSASAVRCRNAPRFTLKQLGRLSLVARLRTAL